MVVSLRNQEIDRERWDECISRSLNRRVYAFSWYLDIVSPGWGGLVTEDYSSVFPLTSGLKAGVSYLFQPFFAQQLGLFSSVALNKGLSEAFLNAIPSRFRYIDIQLTPDFIPETKGGELIPRLNHELSLKASYDELSAAYSQNTKRNIRKARESGVNTGRNLRTADLVTLFRSNFGEREGKLGTVHYARMERLMETSISMGTGTARAAYDESGLLSAAAFFLQDADRVYFLFAASSAEARENGAMFLLIDTFIKENAGKAMVLDFEGGNDENLGRFYKSFGAVAVTYRRLLINRLPFLLDAGLKLARSARRKVK